MIRPQRSPIAAALLAGVLAACGNGGGAGRTVPATQSGTSGSTIAAQFSLLIPNATSVSAAQRKAAFVSPSTLSGTIQVNSGALQELDLSAVSPNCTTVSGGRSCRISVVAPIGGDTFSVVLYDGAFTGGFHTGTALSRASSFSSTITEGSANVSLPLVLGGIPASVDVAVAGTFVAGAPNTLPLVVTAYDAQNNVIIGGAGYVDPGGSPLLTVTTSITSSQVTLHDSAQNGSTVYLTAPSDAPTLQISGAADILGVPFVIKNGSGIRLPAHTSQVVAISGTLNPTLVVAASITDQPDYQYFAPMDGTQATNMPNGFLFSIGTQSSGDYLGYFDSSTETFSKCTFGSSFNGAVSAVDGGIAVSYDGDYILDQAPFGVAFYTKATITAGGACGTGSRLMTVNSHARSMAYDQPNLQLVEADGDNTIYKDAFNGSAFSAHTLVASYPSIPTQMVSANGTTTYLVGPTGTSFYQRTPPSAPASYGTSAAVLTALALGPDGFAYALDSSSKQVWVKSSLATAFLFSSGAFSGSVSNQSNMLAIGPDGNAYSSDGASLVRSLTAGGVASNLTLPNIGGNVGYVRGVFDGKNGYLYAWYDDGLHNGTQNVYRISH